MAYCTRLAGSPRRKASTFAATRLMSRCLVSRAFHPMWGVRNYIVHAKKGIVRLRRFRVLHVKGGPGDHAALQGLDQVRLPDDRATSRIDDERGTLHQLQTLSVDQVARLRGERTVNADD